METCATLGMLNKEQARELRDAGLDYYNHNISIRRANRAMLDKDPCGSINQLPQSGKDLHPVDTGRDRRCDQEIVHRIKRKMRASRVINLVDRT